MPYTVPNHYDNDDYITASEVAANYRALSRWIGGEMVTADIDAEAIDTQQVERPDRIFTSGNQVLGASGLVDHYGSIWEMRFTSGYYLTIKTPNFFEASHIYTAQLKQNAFSGKTLWIPLPNCGRKFDLEKEAFCKVRFYAHGSGLSNLIDSDDGDGNQYALFVDGTQVPETTSYSTDENNAVGGGIPDYDGGDQSRVSVVTFTWAGQLDAGSHTIEVKVNPRLELAWIYNITFQIQCHWNIV